MDRPADGDPGKGTSAAKAFAWHRNAAGYASAKAAGNVAGHNAVMADITWHGDRSFWLIDQTMSGKAWPIDDSGVIEGQAARSP